MSLIVLFMKRISEGHCVFTENEAFTESVTLSLSEILFGVHSIAKG